MTPPLRHVPERADQTRHDGCYIIAVALSPGEMKDTTRNEMLTSAYNRLLSWCIWGALGRLEGLAGDAGCRSYIREIHHKVKLHTFSSWPQDYVIKWSLVLLYFNMLKHITRCSLLYARKTAHCAAACLPLVGFMLYFQDCPCLYLSLVESIAQLTQRHLVCVEGVRRGHRDLLLDQLHRLMILFLFIVLWRYHLYNGVVAWLLFSE